MPAHAPNPPAQQRSTGQVNDLLPLGDWVRHHSLRSWPVILFLVLICVPSIALVILGSNPSASTFDHVAWIFAAYFAVAWLLLAAGWSARSRNGTMVRSKRLGGMASTRVMRAACSGWRRAANRNSE